eukprot:NODE_9_length_47730_cov_0.323718.p26 type:complete len:144 gc:universal NODE_9_length_47730_cov_0.323718:4928-4497(-)
MSSRYFFVHICVFTSLVAIYSIGSCCYVIAMYTKITSIVFQHIHICVVWCIRNYHVRPFTGCCCQISFFLFHNCWPFVIFYFSIRVNSNNQKITVRSSLSKGIGVPEMHTIKATIYPCNYRFLSGFVFINIRITDYWFRDVVH